MSEKTTQILQQLEQGLQSLFESDHYKDYLRFLASFHSYSFRNSLLIHIQCRQRGITPSLCAPYRDWQQRHRHVKRGEKGIAIIAPHTYKARKAGTDEETSRLGFHIAYTYDISQTEPDDDSGETPEICHKLNGDLADTDLLRFLVCICPCEIRFKPLDGSVNGFYNPHDGDITIDSGNSQAQQCKTLLHEWSHFEHHQDNPYLTEETTAEDRELIAESAAYVVCQYLGVDSSGYSFGYLASWARDNNTKALKRNMDTIRQIADRIILCIEDHLDTAAVLTPAKEPQQ